MPSEETVERAIAIARTGTAAYEFLFDNLKNADWLAPLFKRGFFKAPLDAIREGDYSRFPAWPESRYLARVADQDPAQVLAIALQVPETDNALIHLDLAQAACKMPGTLASEWADHELPWITEQKRLYMLLPEALGRLVQHLASAEEVVTALQLTRVLLQLRLPEGAESTEPWFRHPIGRLDAWDYGEFLRLRIPTLLMAAPEATFKLLADGLEDALQMVTAPEEDVFGRLLDYTFISRPAIEEHPDQRERDHTGDLEIALLLALRNAGETLLSEDLASLEQILGWLEERAPLTFWRIALHLLGMFGDKLGARELIRARLTSPKYFDVIALHHEYLELLRSQAASLSTEDIQALLTLIDSVDEPADDDEAEAESLERLETRKQRWLTELEPYLPEARVTELGALRAKYGERRHPDFHVGPVEVGWIGAKSPRTEEELEAMSPEDFLRFAQSWEEPHNTFFGEAPSYEGLGKTLSAVVSQFPEKFAPIAVSFAGLPPAFTWGYFEGLSAVAERGGQFDWEPPLRLLRASVVQRDSERESLRAPSWDWANRSGLGLVEKGLQLQTSGLTTGYRDLVWEALVDLTDHPEPTPEYEQQYSGSNMDPLTLSINTVRGVAMNAVVEYALWLHRNGELGHGFADAPEISEVLLRHLEVEGEPSQAIRAVYGRWLPWLFLLDRDWTGSNVHRMLAEGGPLASVAWNTYVTSARPFNDVLPGLLDYYAGAIDAMTDHEDDKSTGMHSPNDSMASHLMSYFWRGLLDLEEGGLIDRFFRIGSPKTLGFAIESIGRGLQSASKDVTQRPITLWDWRVTSGMITTDELEAFGWWAASPSLDPDWSLRNLALALRIAGKVDAPWLVAERLSVLADDHGSAVLAALRLMIEGKDEPWSITHWEKDIRSILSTTLASSDPALREDAKNLTNLLGAKGYWNFQDLLK